MLFRKLASSSLALALVSLVSAQQSVPVTGVQTGIDRETGAVPARQNINDLYGRGGPAWTLYVRAMTAMQNTDPHDQLSYFQVCGVHGLPAISWNGGGDREGPYAGYCPHGENLFLPWHRAYIAVFEQVLQAHALRIADEYPESVRSGYRQAAETLRAPYWDWAENSNVPPCTAQQQVQIQMPNQAGDGVDNVMVSNPLYTFVYPDAVQQGEFGTFSSTQTYRCRDSSGNSRPEAGNPRLQSLNLKQAVYTTFTRATTFDAMGSTMVPGSSFESPHNSVHVYATCGEQFSQVNEAAMDPLFMLHHCNIDRLWAYWQSMYPNEKMFRTTYASRGTYSIAQGTPISPNTPIEPFFGPDGSNLQTSAGVTEMNGLGYTYESLEYWRLDQEGLRSAATSLVNQKYGPSPSRKRGALESRAQKTEYFIKVEIDLEKMERPCSMNIYVGGKLAGPVAVLGAPTSGKTYHLLPLENVVELNDLRRSKKGVLYMIEKNLQVEFLKPNGTAIPPDTVTGYTIEVEDVDVDDTPSGDRLPKYGSSRHRPVKPKPVDLAVSYGHGEAGSIATIPGVDLIV